MQLPGLSIGIVADDMTGACDTALQFFAPGKTPAAVLLDGRTQAAPREATVWSVTMASRHKPALEAAVLARQATARLRDDYGVVNFYKKIDSTLRGHIAHECLGMLEELNAQCAIIAPAYPEEGRRTVGGYQLVRGVPVERTSIARDPLFPVRQSHIPSLLGEATNPGLVGHIELSAVLHGAGPILVRLNELIKSGKRLVVADAATSEDLEQIALAIEKSQKSHRVLPCGSAGLAQALTRPWTGAPTEGVLEASPLQLPGGPILLVSGSLTETTRAQVIHLMENYDYVAHGSVLRILEIPADQLLGLTDCRATVEALLDAMTDKNTVLLSSALKEEHFRRTVQLADEHELTENEVSMRVQTCLAEITRQALEQRSPKLVITGGETTYQVCRAIGSQRLEIAGRIDRAIPLCRDLKGRWIVTKSGGFGLPAMLTHIVQYLKQRESAALYA